MYSDSKRIRTRNARSIHRSDVDTWGFSSSVAWQSFDEVVPNVIGPTSTTCERVVHHPAVVHYYVICVFPSIIIFIINVHYQHYATIIPSIPPSLPLSLPPSLPTSLLPSLPPSLHRSLLTSLPPSLREPINLPTPATLIHSRLQDSFTAHRPVAATRANSAPFTY